ncbi:hypothetical protein BOVAB4_4353 [Bacteroides ovatus]|nr:hypothetical protein BOVAB4_4353 [Bacteroides ovatus]
MELAATDGKMYQMRLYHLGIILSVGYCIDEIQTTYFEYG